VGCPSPQFGDMKDIQWIPANSITFYLTMTIEPRFKRLKWRRRVLIWWEWLNGHTRNADILEKRLLT
ncbi:hypothetical protein NDU88_000055, partial [Pleurodeles waltl]